MKLYLAHPLNLRHEIRKVELEIEQETGVELYNPFYDSTGRDDIVDIDEGKKSRNDTSIDCNKLVRRDLDGIASCPDGVVAYIQKGVYSIGTICECWDTFRFKPVYVVSPDSLNHPWVRYFVAFSGGKGFTSWEEFKQFVKGVK